MEPFFLSPLSPQAPRLRRVKHLRRRRGAPPERRKRRQSTVRPSCLLLHTLKLHPIYNLPEGTYLGVAAGWETHTVNKEAMPPGADQAGRAGYEAAQPSEPFAEVPRATFRTRHATATRHPPMPEVPSHPLGRPEPGPTGANPGATDGGHGALLLSSQGSVVKR